jgi:hypothetical protein
MIIDLHLCNLKECFAQAQSNLKGLTICRFGFKMAIPSGIQNIMPTGGGVGSDQSHIATRHATLSLRQRKGHRKSRQGCFACKQRKIKVSHSIHMLQDRADAPLVSRDISNM